MSSSDMHNIVVDEFDCYLNGTASAAFHEHLNGCEACRTTVRAMSEVTLLIRDFRVEDSECPEPPAGFYNRVANRIIEKEGFAWWGLWSLGPAFFRRMAFASLLVLAGLGSFLVSRESAGGQTDAASIMAQHDSSGTQADAADRDRLLVTLASYRE
jgi:predicted anti-sigma-YlaC factor YlaD